MAKELQNDKNVRNMVQIPLEIDQEQVQIKGSVSSYNSLQVLQPQEQNSKSLQDPVSKGTYKETTITLFKSFIGSGVIAMPYSFYIGGYMLSTIIFALVAILINYSQVMVVRLAEACQKDKELIGYSEMVSRTLGSVFGSISDFFIISMQWGCCVSYMLFFMQFFEYAFYQSSEASLQHQMVYLAFAMCIILPMTLLNSLALFSKISAIANILVLVTLTAVLSFAASNINQDTPEYQQAKTQTFVFSRMQTVIGVAIWAFEAVGTMLDIKNSMKKTEKFKRMLQLITFAAVVLNIIFSVVCSLGFGYSIKQIVLFSMPNGRFDVSFLQICYAVALAMSFPLQLLPAFHLVEKIQPIKEYVNPNENNYLLKRTLLRLLQVLMISFIALGIPEFAVFLSFIGGMSGSALQFFFPLLVFRKIFWNKYEYLQIRKNEKILFTTSMIIGIVLGLYAMFFSFIELVS